ncbi:MAG: hypothetical protein Q9220_002281 [cf. Caloplaca sp. 1 TL-2023]
MLHHKATADKARHYLDLLDAARCNGSWSEVPELARKVAKHSPERKCLHLTALAEYQAATTTTSAKSPIPPSVSPALSRLVPGLLSASQAATAPREDVFQAQVCLGWIHSILNEPLVAIQRIPENVPEVYKDLSQAGSTVTGWTSVCAVRGAYIRGESQETSGDENGALSTYQSVIPEITTMLQAPQVTLELRTTIEKLLARCCILTSIFVKRAAYNHQDSRGTGTTLAPFRAWAELWASVPKDPSSSGLPPRGSVPRRQTWRLYFDILSEMLQKGLPYPIMTQGPSATAKEMSSDHVKSLENPRLQQSLEMQKIEDVYDEILHKEVSFPKANETNLEVESWADQIMVNWRVVSGPRWRNEDVGRGGKEAATRRLLAALYRAAFRTFHSARVLRHLFTVHCALAEFSVAAKAFDTYVELVNRGKSRVSKSGESETGLDDDATVLCTTAAGIQLLCYYGQIKDVERAQEIATILERWLGEMRSPLKPAADANDNPNDETDEDRQMKLPVPGEAVSAAHRSLGICRAHWARLTPDVQSRPELQVTAIASFRQALQSDTVDRHRGETYLAFALLLAETREIDEAVAAAKAAISLCAEQREEGLPSRHQTSDDSPEDRRRRRLMFKAWHLLAFLLSARQDFATATASCDAAYDLYGEQLGAHENSQLTQQLSLSEREQLIELKMSQLALCKTIEGAGEAVNESGDLLVLYKHLFDYGEGPKKGPLPAPSAFRALHSPPRSTNGSSSSARRSVLGRSKDAIRTFQHAGHHSSNGIPTGDGPVDVATNPVAPVDGDEAGIQRTYQPPAHLARQESRKLHKRQSRRSVTNDRHSRGVSPTKSSLTDDHQGATQLLPSRGSGKTHSRLKKSNGSASIDNGASDTTTAKETPTKGHDPSASVMTSSLPPTSSQKAYHQDFKIPSKHPEPFVSNPSSVSPNQSFSSLALPDPIFPSLDLSQHALVLLTRIWLLIAQLYREAGMPIDAQGALSEAFNQAQSLQAIVAATDSSALSFSTSPWGSVKSVAEVWADVHAEQAEIHLQFENIEGANEEFEKALNWFPDHNAATVGLATLLLDYYSEEEGNPKHTEPSSEPPASKPVLATLPPLNRPGSELQQANGFKPEESPMLLSRLAARDRAYGLLSMLTKSGRGWDDSEAWFALARAYEESGQVGKAKEALWWVVELENGRPLRPWSCLGGFP